MKHLFIALSLFALTSLSCLAEYDFVECPAGETPTRTGEGWVCTSGGPSVISPKGHIMHGYLD